MFTLERIDPPRGGNFPPLVNGPVFKVHAAKLGKKLCISLFVRPLSYSAGPKVVLFHRDRLSLKKIAVQSLYVELLLIPHPIVC